MPIPLLDIPARAYGHNMAQRPTDTAAFRRVGRQLAFGGHHLQVAVEEFERQPGDGGVYQREIVETKDVVVICAYDEDGVWLVSQPREAAGEADLLELPAGGIDDRDAEPLDAARRELAEEIGKGADEWELVHSFYSSPGIVTERVYLYLATGLHDSYAQADEDERLNLRQVPLSALDELIEDCRSGMALIGLMELRRRLS